MFSNCPKSLPKNHPDCTILCKRIFESLILADKTFAKGLQIFETFVVY